MIETEEIPVKKSGTDCTLFQNLLARKSKAENDISIALCEILNDFEKDTGFPISAVRINIENLDIMEDRKELSTFISVDTRPF